VAKMQYPIEVSNIKSVPLYRDHNRPEVLFGGKCGALVSVRPCGEKYGDKTYLGILLGDLPLQVYASYNKESKELEIGGYSNPAIFVPELKEIVWGCGSWWGNIKSEEELRQISDDDIQNVWYVKMLKSMQEDAPHDTKEAMENIA